MRVDFIGHASLLIRHGGLSLLCDPWWAGGAFRNQWFPYPIPVADRYQLRGLDALYVSHGHEDHLHRATLQELKPANQDTYVVVPRTADLGMRQYLGRIGFERIREVASGKSVILARDGVRMRLTVMTHLDDSMLAVEAGGEVLLNVNDALHSSRMEIIEEYCRVLRRRFPRIDYLFCGFGGASYFPNCIHVPGKDDVAVARAREAWFLRNFARIAELLKPRFAFPFAAHFVLPDERTWWISATRLAMGPPGASVRLLLGDSSLQVQVHDLSPGDFVDGGVVHASPPSPLADVSAARDTVLARYPAPPPAAALSPEAFAALVDDVRVTACAHAAAGGRGAPFHTALTLWDYPSTAITVRRAADGTVDVSTAAPRELGEAEAIVATRSDLVKSLMHSPFGRDLITVGYGAQVRLRSTDVLRRNPHEQLLNLLAPPRPRWRERFRRHPSRTASFLVRDQSMRYAARTKLAATFARSRRPTGEPAPYEIGDWVTATEE